jgi:hypothetical protein
MPATPIGAVGNCVDCQFGLPDWEPVNGIGPVPGLTKPGMPGIVYGSCMSFVSGMEWQLELQVKVAAAVAAGNPQIVLLWLPHTPEEFLNDSFIVPYLQYIPQPIPNCTLDLGVCSVDIEEQDAYGVLDTEMGQARYGPNSSWTHQIQDFLKFLALLLTIPFMIFWKMVEKLLTNPLELPLFPPTRDDLEAMINDIAQNTFGFPPDNETLGKFSGCFAESLVSIAV